MQQEVNNTQFYPVSFQQCSGGTTQMTLAFRHQNSHEKIHDLEKQGLGSNTTYNHALTKWSCAGHSNTLLWIFSFYKMGISNTLLCIFSFYKMGIMFTVITSSQARPAAVNRVKKALSEMFSWGEENNFKRCRDWCELHTRAHTHTHTHTHYQFPLSEDNGCRLYKLQRELKHINLVGFFFFFLSLNIFLYWSFKITQ